MTDSLPPTKKCHVEAFTLAELFTLIPADCNQLQVVRRDGMWCCMYMASIVPVDAA